MKKIAVVTTVNISPKELSELLGFKNGVVTSFFHTEEPNSIGFHIEEKKQ